MSINTLHKGDDDYDDDDDDNDDDDDDNNNNNNKGNGRNLVNVVQLGVETRLTLPEIDVVIRKPTSSLCHGCFLRSYLCFLTPSSRSLSLPP